MSPGPTFDRVYASLKEQLQSGRWLPGTHLEPAVIGEELNASITPVRDALHRLVGERLIAVPRHDGFWVPTITETELRDMYAWNGKLVGWALRNQRQPWSAAIGDEEIEASALFRDIARGADSLELGQAIVSSVDRLAQFSAVEAVMLDGMAEELSRLRAALRENTLDPLRRELAAYHRRRQRAAPAILGARR